MNELVFGKDNTDRIVSVEYKDGVLTAFREMPDGSIVEEFKPSKYWFLTDSRASAKQTILKGNQHYKYLAEFDLEEDYLAARQACQFRKRDYWCAWDNKEMVLLREGITYFKGLKHSEISILSFDIEANGLKLDTTSKALLITNTFRDIKGRITKKSFSMEDYEDAPDQFFNDWCAWVREMNPSILCGHNIFGYDLGYLDFCAKQVGAELCLGRDGSAITFNKYPSKFRKDQSQSYEYHNAKVYGRELIDTLFLAIKYDTAEKKYVSYGLKQIIKQEGLEKPGRVFVDASKIGEYYRNRHKDPTMWNNVKEYGADDSDDALKLFDLMAPSFFYFTQSIPKSFQQINNTATGAQLNSYMVRAYIQEGYSIPKATELTSGFEGAISFGVPGIYSNCYKVDVSSLYPSIMEQWEVFDKVKDPKSFFLKTVKYFREQRLKNKKLAKETGDTYYKDLEQSQKILINSLYGFLGAPGLNFNSPFYASFVTEKGREILSEAIKFATGEDVTYWKTKAKGEEEENETDEADVA